MKLKTLITVLALAFSCVLTFGASVHWSNYHHFDAVALPPNGVYKYTGKLNGRIPVFVWFTLQDGVMKGEVTYLKTAQRVPIKLLGMVRKYDGLVIHEFSKGGNITGTFRGDFNQAAFNGSWYAPSTGKELKFNLQHKDTVLTLTDTTLHPMAATGEYQYHFGKTGGDGGINIQVLKPDLCKADIECNTAAPELHVATVEAFTAKLNNNVFYYKVEDGDCKFKIKMFRDFVVIEWLPGEDSSCGFGMNANIEGVYLKTGSKATFSVP